MLPCACWEVREKDGMGFSMVWVIDLLIHLVYKAAGLRPHTVALDDDTTVHCWISSSLLPPSSAIRSKEKKAKPLLLLIHGFGPRGTWQWSRQIWHLAARFDLVVPDLLFFGGSTTRSPIRSEAFQAAAISRLLAVLGVGPPHRARVSVAGTSYGGFVAYHVARALGPEWVERVVIASSDVLKGPDDDRALLERAGGARSIDELLLPRTTADLRRLARLAVYRPPLSVPEFILRDMLQVNVPILGILQTISPILIFPRPCILNSGNTKITPTLHLVVYQSLSLSVHRPPSTWGGGKGTEGRTWQGRRKEKEEEGRREKADDREAGEWRRGEVRVAMTTTTEVTMTMVEEYRSVSLDSFWIKNIIKEKLKWRGMVRGNIQKMSFF